MGYSVVRCVRVLFATNSIRALGRAEIRKHWLTAAQLAVAAVTLIAPAPAWSQSGGPLPCLLVPPNQNGVNLSGFSTTVNGPNVTTSTNATIFAQSVGGNGASGKATPNPYTGGSAGPVSVINNGTIFSPGLLFPINSPWAVS